MVSINLDITFIIQAVNFIVALAVLNYVIIKPIRNILKQRRALLDEMLNESEKFNSEADSRLKNYETELEAARVAAGVEKERLRQEGHEAGQGILSRAHGEAQDLLQKAGKELESEMSVSFSALRGQVPDLAGKAATRLLS